MPDAPAPSSVPHRREPSARDVRRWRHHLADELAEAAIYRDLAAARTGSEREILLALADAEGRHAEHWRTLLGPERSASVSRSLYSRVLGLGARRFGSVFTLALAQHAESRSAYDADVDATARMAADERIHEEVIRSLATRGRIEMSGNFRAAVFGLNDGLVSNLALILGIGATGVSAGTVLATGAAGLLAGAMSMGAGEFVSVRSQVELARASQPSPRAREALCDLDVDANELSLVYRARGLDAEAAAVKARRTLELVARADAAEAAAAADVLPGTDVVPGDGAVPGEGAVPGAGGAAENVADGARGPDVVPGEGAVPGAGGAVENVADGARGPDVVPGDDGAGEDVLGETARAAGEIDGRVAAALEDPAAAEVEGAGPDAELLGSAWGAAVSSFFLFAGGALVPLLPFILGMTGGSAMIVAAVLVGLVLLGTGATVGVLSGASPWTRALRQIAIGFGAAGVTYLLGLAFGTTLG